MTDEIYSKKLADMQTQIKEIVPDLLKENGGRRMSELKRCPFCGGLPTTEVRVTQMGSDTDNVDFSVVCVDCGTFKTVRLRIAKKAVFMDVEKAMSQVIEVWNKRAERKEE